MLCGIYRDLINDLFHAYESSPSGVKAMQFRAQHEDHLSELDELEESRYVEVDRSAQCYRITLLTLVELRDEDNHAAELISQCRRLFDTLRQAYKVCPGCQVTLPQLIERTGLQAIQVRTAWTYLMHSPASCSSMDDLLGAEKFALIPGESYLRYKTFDAVIERLGEWEEASSFAKRARHTVNEKVPKFRREMGQGSRAGTQAIPSWYDRLPSSIQDLMWEVYFAVDKELSALPSMGLRAVVDWVCNDKIGDVGGLGQKLKELTRNGYITESDRQIVENMIEVGHASVHRSHFPQPDEVQLAVRIVERFLEGIYILDAASRSLRDSTPKRGEA